MRVDKAEKRRKATLMARDTTVSAHLQLSLIIGRAMYVDTKIVYQNMQRIIEIRVNRVQQRTKSIVDVAIKNINNESLQSAWKLL